VDRRGTGAAAATVFTVALSSEGEPASAPSASASLRGPDGVVRTMPLVLAEAGHWTSDRLSVAPGTYRLLTRFDRLGDPIEIPVTVAVPR
jgi:hypothetical protein